MILPAQVHTLMMMADVSMHQIASVNTPDGLLWLVPSTGLALVN